VILQTGGYIPLFGPGMNVFQSKSGNSLVHMFIHSYLRSITNTKSLMKRILLILLLFAAGGLYGQTTAHRDEAFTELFRRTSGWTAGELSCSVPISGGRSLWLFRFSNIDNYQSGDTSVTCNAQVKNTMVVQSISSPGSFTTILDHTKTDVNRTPFKLADDEPASFIPSAGFSKGDTAYVILRRLNNDFSYGGAYVAKIYTPGMTDASSIASISPLPAMNDIQFGSAVLVDTASNYVYIYGSKANWIVFEPYVARVSMDDILGSWEFYNGSGWTTNAAAAQKIMTDYTPTTFSVLYIQGKYYMITQDHNFFGSCDDAKKIIAYESRHPYGPFENRKELFTLDDQHQGNKVRTFEATAHPEFTENNELLISYNVSNICPAQCVNDRVNADLLRPRFVRVPLTLIDSMIGHPAFAVIKAPYTWDYAPLPVSFDGSASRDAYAEGLTYAWSFGDGATATGNAKVQHTYANPGTYTARLIVSNLRGDRDTATVTVNAIQPTTPAYKDRTFTEYFRRTAGWIASDGTLSVPLPNGKTIWMFGDSHIDDFDPTDQTIPCLFQLRNAMMVQDDVDRNSFVTIIDQTKTGVNRTPIKLVDNDTTLFWPMHGYVKGDTAYLFWIRGHSTKLTRQGNYIAKVYWPTLTSASSIVSLSPVPVPDDDMPLREWGNAVVTDTNTNYAYIYGFKQDWIINVPFVARVSMNNVLGTWEFYDGTGWTTEMNNAQAILPSGGYVSPSFSVVKVQSKYYLITQDIGFLTCGLGRDIYAYESDTPYGPFIHKKTLYTIEDKYNGSYIITYNATAHPEFMDNDELLISYNLNDVCPSLCVNMVERIDPDVYRPKFIRVPLSFLTQPPDDFVMLSDAAQDNHSLTVVAYPNPANVNEVSLKIGMPQSSDVQVTVYTLSGKAKQKHQLGVQVSGEVTHVLDLSTLPSGTYIVKVKTARETKTIKLVRE
jgi:PKD repeat protein